MSSISIWLAGSTSLNFVFLLLAIVSIIISIYFYLISKKEKLPVYLIKNFQLIEDNIATIDGLELKFNNQTIKNLSLIKIAFWNKGRETIHGTDIAQTDKLRIELKGDVKLLGAKYSYLRRPVNSMSLNQIDNSIHIGFDFIDHLDGCVIDVYLSGKGKIKICGTIKGTSGVQVAKLEDDHFLKLFLERYLSWLRHLKLMSPFRRRLIIFPIALILLPILIPLIILGSIIQTFQKVPSEYII